MGTKKKHCQEAETLLKRQMEQQQLIRIYREEIRDLKRIENALRGKIKDLKKQIARMESRQFADNQQEEGDVESVRDPLTIVTYVYDHLKKLYNFCHLVRFLSQRIRDVYVFIRPLFQRI